MDLGLQGRVALVTASSKGLGLGTARALATEGASVTICARGADDLELAAASMAALPGEVLAVPGDVADPETPARLVEATVERFGGLHILVANAGGPPPGGPLDLEDDAVLDAVNENLLASIRLVRAGLPHLRAAGWGRICLITSHAVKQPIPGLAASSVARTGLWAWAKTAARELAPEGITVNVACPGPHRTDRALELGLEEPMGDPDDFGRIVTFLCSQPAGFINGAALQVDGAGTIGLL